MFSFFSLGSLDIPSTDVSAVRATFPGEKGSPDCHTSSFFDSIGRSGGQGGNLDTIYKSVLSLLAYAEPACSETPNFQHIHLEHPESKELWGVWHPLSSKSTKLFEHAIFATRDIKKGDRIIIDDSHWNSFGDDSHIEKACISKSDKK